MGRSKADPEVVRESYRRMRMLSGELKAEAESLLTTPGITVEALIEVYTTICAAVGLIEAVSVLALRELGGEP